MGSQLLPLALAVVLGSSHVAPAERTLEVAGARRRFLLVAFAASAPTPRPLVLLLHGRGGSAERLIGLTGWPSPYSVWVDIAAREGLLLAVPASDGRQGWNDCRGTDTNPSSDDVGFLEAVVDAVAREHPVDHQRVYVVGTSNGGFMALRLAVERPKRFAGVAAIAAAMPTGGPCPAPTSPVPVLFMNGTRDGYVPFSGGPIARGRGSVLSTPASGALWVRVNGASPSAEPESLPDLDPDDGSRVTRERHHAGPAGAPVVLYRVEGGGHTEPSRRARYGGLLRRMSGQQNGDIEMAEEVWSFFRSLGARE